MRLELKFIHRCIETLSRNRVEAIIIDTIGIERRKKSILATYHGRYHTIGMSDLRAVSTDMLPVFLTDHSRNGDHEASNGAYHDSTTGETAKVNELVKKS